MVKRLDKIEMPELLDHAGWRIWRLADGWKREFDAVMIARGHSWFGDARSKLLQHINHKGTPQTMLVSRVGLTKQAVQQLIDELAADGFVERITNPDDRRSNVVRFTKKGLQLMADINIAKEQIQKRYASVLGPKRFADFMEYLEILNSDESHEV